jgi:hypothetical protein
MVHAFIILLHFLPLSLPVYVTIQPSFFANSGKHAIPNFKRACWQMAEMSTAVWQDVAPLTGWLTSDAEAMRLQRSLRHAADALAAKKDAAEDGNCGEAAAFGASILRSKRNSGSLQRMRLEEEQRLVAENATLRSQLDALRRQFDSQTVRRRGGGWP